MQTRLALVVLTALVLVASPPPAQVELISIPSVVTDSVLVSIPAASLRLAGTGDGDGSRSDPVESPIPFTMVGFRLPDGVDKVRVRIADEEGRWNDWFEAERAPSEEGPDPDSEEGRRSQATDYTEPVFVGEASGFQLELPADEASPAMDDVEVAATVLDTEGLSGGPVTRTAITADGPVAEASSAPKIITRDQWGATPYRGTPSYREKVDLTVVHHTAGTNDYTEAQAAGIVRGVQRYHQDSNGWSDIGYNVLVDRFGNLYEGRAGGLDRGVIGAHAAGYNDGSFGISVLGNFVAADAPEAVYTALAETIAWKAGRHGFDPLGVSGRTAKGLPVPTVTGHGDVGSTTCPGRLRDGLARIRAAASASSPSAPVPEGPAATLSGFADVPETSTHYQSVRTAHATNVLLGYTAEVPAVFRPGWALNRGDMARAVAVALDIDPVADWRGRFSDIDDVPWLAPYIVGLVDAGILDGYTDGTFRPRQSLRRDQMATYLANALQLPQRRPTFTDLNEASPHYRNIGAVQQAGIARGVDAASYGPHQTMRRDQSASLLVRAFDLAAAEPRR